MHFPAVLMLCRRLVHISLNCLLFFHFLYALFTTPFKSPIFLPELLYHPRFDCLVPLPPSQLSGVRETLVVAGERVGKPLP